MSAEYSGSVLSGGGSGGGASGCLPAVAACSQYHTESSTLPTSTTW